MTRKDENLTEYSLVTDIPLSLNEQRISKMNKVIPKLKYNELNHAGTMIKVGVRLLSFFELLSLELTSV